MEITAHFKDIRKTITEELTLATDEILIAVAWFTNRELFEILISKLIKGKVRISVLIINDTININPLGLDFQRFIDLGGHFYLAHAETPMHNKYCIVDKKVLLSGSYNYTYLAEQINEENIIKLKGVSDVINQYCENFNTLLSTKQVIKSLSSYLLENPTIDGMLSRKRFGIKDLYQKAIEYKDLEQIYESSKLISRLSELSSDASLESFEINDIIYRQWKHDYHVDKAIVSNSKLILFFRTNSNTGSWLYGPGGNHSWLIRNTNAPDKFSKVDNITNVKINKVVILDHTAPLTFYCFEKDRQSIKYVHDTGHKRNSLHRPIDNEGNEIPIVLIPVEHENYEMTCELHFSIDQIELSTIDLVEGLGTDQCENHWHCFDINLQINRKPILSA